jgi:hypothetical protein
MLTGSQTGISVVHGPCTVISSDCAFMPEIWRIHPLRSNSLTMTSLDQGDCRSSVAVIRLTKINSIPKLFCYLILLESLMLVYNAG